MTNPKSDYALHVNPTYKRGPARDTDAALVLPVVNTKAMKHHLAEISATVATGAHAIIPLDQAGWHTTRELEVPDNLSLKTCGYTCASRICAIAFSKTTSTLSSVSAKRGGRCGSRPVVLNPALSRLGLRRSVIVTFGVSSRFA